MNTEPFNARMMAIDENLQTGELALALAAANALRTELMAEAIVDGDMVCWAVYYELRTLHALEQWKEFAALMRDLQAFVAIIGPKNAGYAYSLMMEAVARGGDVEELPEWAGRCFVERLRNDDLDSLKMAVDTAIALLDMAERADLDATVFDQLAAAAQETGQAQVYEMALQWAADARSGS